MIDPNKVAFVFPGQGSQAIGMGQDITNVEPDAKNTLRIVAEECDFDLYKTCFIGPEEALKKTNYAQPAILGISAACLQALRRYWGHNPKCVAGHSLGEITALWAAEVLTIQEAAKLTVLRGQLMNNAPQGAMSAVMSISVEELEKVCQEFNINIANYNTPTQLVISGDKEQVQKAGEKLIEFKARVIPLAVSGAFHSPLMNDPNAKFKNALDNLDFKSPVIPVVQNVTAKAVTDPITLKENLSKQMVSSVQWIKTVENILGIGVELFIEIGHGKVLNGLIKKIDKNAKVLNVSDSDSLKDTLKALGVEMTV